MTTSRAVRCTVAGLAILVLGATAACSGGSSDSASSSAAGGGNDSAVAGAPARAGAGAAGKAAATATDDGATGAKVISTGSVELTADDVPDARFDVLTVVARYGGQVSDEEATTSDDPPTNPSPGVPGAAADTTTTAAAPAIARTHLVVRVPSADFDRAMRDLAGIGHFVASSRQSQDVTTQVIDTRARVRVQARSVHRIEQLLDRATDIADIVAVEGQLSRRQAALESLRGRAAYLADQTSLATITVDLSTTTSAQRHADRSAFVAGLVSGWHGLTRFLGGLAATVGALLPFLLVLGPVALVLWWLRRTRGSRRAAPAGVVPDETAP